MWESILILILQIRTKSSTGRDYWTALRPYSAAGGYMNFMMDEGEDRIRATYRENYDRLAAIKAKYDPDNFFRVNQNIKPGSQRRNAGIA